LQPHIEVRDVSRETLMCIVAMGEGITLTSEAVLGLGITGLQYRDLVESTGQFRAGYSGYWREDNRNPVLTRFLKFVRERYSLPPLRS
jgi:DNA-binding transcriptional LysR family regulator